MSRIMTERAARKIKYISFALAIGVIFIHTYNADVYELSGMEGIFATVLLGMEKFSNKILNSICVPYFFFLSGYLFFRNYSWNKVGSKYLSRVRTLLIPYILWCTLGFVTYACLTHLSIFARHMNMETVELSFSNYLYCLWNSNYTVLWFVKYLIFTIIPTPVLFLFISRKKKKAWDITSGAICVGLFVFILFMDTGIIRLSLPLPLFNPYFFLGGVLSIRGTDFIERRKKVKTIAGIVGTVPVIISLWYAQNSLLKCILTFLSILMIWYAVDIFSFSKEPTWWMGQTFFIYCAHSILLEGLEKVWLVVGGKSVWTAAMDYFIMPFIVLTILALSAIFLDKYCHPIYSVLTGGRSKRGRIRNGKI